LAAITRNATSSWQRRSIARAERTPIAYPYSSSATIIAGSCAERPPPVLTVGAIESVEIELGNRVDHQPRKMILRQPIADARRQQQLLLAITRIEVLRHAVMVLKPSDGTPLCDTLREEQWRSRRLVLLDQRKNERPRTEPIARSSFSADQQ